MVMSYIYIALQYDILVAPTVYPIQKICDLVFRSLLLFLWSLEHTQVHASNCCQRISGNILQGKVYVSLKSGVI